MTKARTPAGSGAEKYGSDQIPTSITWPTVPSVRNRVRDQVVPVKVRDGADASADFVFGFIAEDNGRIEAIRFQNGSVAADGTNGLELEFLNTDNSDERVAYFGFGSGTEAAKATDTDSAVAANEVTELTNSIAKNFDKGDWVQVTADRDGTTIVGDITLIVSYGAEGSADD